MALTVCFVAKVPLYSVRRTCCVFPGFILFLIGCSVSVDVCSLFFHGACLMMASK
jgi:hypothetical protein